MLSNMTQQQTKEVVANSQANDNAVRTLGDNHAEASLLFSETVKSFESMSEGDSREFLKKCRQTGGE